MPNGLPAGRAAAAAGASRRRAPAATPAGWRAQRSGCSGHSAPGPAIEVGVALLIWHLLNHAFHPHLQAGGSAASASASCGACLAMARLPNPANMPSAGHVPSRRWESQAEDGALGPVCLAIHAFGHTLCCFVPTAAPPYPTCRCRGSHHQASAATWFSSSCLPCMQEQGGSIQKWGARIQECTPAAQVWTRVGKDLALSPVPWHGSQRPVAQHITVQRSAAQRSVP